MNISEKLLRECDDLIATLQGIKSLISKNSERFDESYAASIGTGKDIMVFIHADDTDQAKALARSIGGAWSREMATNGNLSYRQRTSQLDWIIFDAEKLPEPTPLEL